jgi:hypothetical protein
VTADTGDLPHPDPNTPSPARIYNYLLGGSHNFAADRQAAEAITAQFPQLPEVFRAGRAFGRRSTHYLAADQGITQFLDLGSGIPAAPCVHEIAQAANPAARIAYLDIDPIAVAHARRLLADVPGTTAVHGDLRDPAAVCSSPAVREVIDFGQPVAVILSAVLHFIASDAEAASIVDRYMNAAAPGSFLVISHHADAKSEQEARARDVYRKAAQQLIPRTREQVTAFFHATELTAPGVVLSPLWRPDPGESPGHPPLYFGYVGVGRKA